MAARLAGVDQKVKHRHQLCPADIAGGAAKIGPPNKVINMWAGTSSLSADGENPARNHFSA
jgi:hypothetical protein